MTEVTTVLSQVLAAHLASGEELQARPHTLSEAKVAGFIDGVAVDEAGRRWILGWAKGEIGDAMGVLILDRAKHCGSLVIARFARGGLAPGATGFIGILQSDWEPQVETGPVAMVLACEGQPHLRNSGDGLRRVSVRSLAQIADAAQGSLSGAYHNEIASLLKAPESWVPGMARLTNTPVDVAIDNVVAIPGVGCVVEGWVVSPRQAVTGFSLQAGTAVSRAEVRSTYRLPRPDLAGGFPRAAETLGDAGFVAFFPQPSAGALASEMTLKVHLGRRDSVNIAVPEAVVRWLHRRSGEEVLLRCYPALDCEPFFPAMAASIKRAALMQGSRPVIWRATPTQKALVYAVADHPDEPFRVMEALDQWRDLAQEHGLDFVLLAPEARRRETLKLVRDWPMAEGEPKLNLFFQTNDVVTPMDVALILKALETKAAVIVREGMRLTTAALAHCLERLALETAEDTPAAALYPEADLASIRESEGPGVLVWSTQALDAAARGCMSWAEMPTDPQFSGALERSIRPQAKRQMLRVLQQAGLKI